MPPKLIASPPDLSPAFEKLKLAAREMPDLEEGASYGIPALKAGGRLARISIEERAHRLERDKASAGASGKEKRPRSQSTGAAGGRR